jgi:hypothetical protein
MKDESFVSEGNIHLLDNIDIDYVKLCSDEDTCFFTELFLNKNTKRNKIKLHEYLDKRIIEFSEHIREYEDDIEHYTRKLTSLKDDLKRMREKSNEYLTSFISIEKELYKQK